MLYYIQINGETLKVEVTSDTAEHLKVRLADSQELPVDFQAVLDNNFYSLIVDGKSHQVHLEKGEGQNHYLVELDGVQYEVEAETERQHRLANLAPRSNAATGEVTVKAPMPGLVTIIRVQLGDEVNQGDRLVVLEAMKMENELRAPRAGKVKSINVNAGQTVEQNRVLVVLE